MDAKKFLAIEAKYNLNSLNVQGVDYWNYSRFDIWTNYICKELLSLGSSNGNYSIDLFSYLKRIKYFFNKPYHKGECEILYLNHPRRVKIGSLFECPYTEDLNKLYKSVTIEDEFQQKHFTPNNTPNLIYTDKYTILASLYARAIHLYRKNYKKTYIQIKNQINSAINEFNDTYDCRIDLDTICKKITKDIYCIKCIRYFLNRLIKEINPKIIVEVVHYRTINMIINEIAKDYGITTIELQHGIIYPYHISYQYNKGVSIKQFPDKIFLFSDYWKASIQAPIKDDYLIPVGYPYFEKNLSKYVTHIKNSNRYTILFVSQGTIGKKLSEFAARLVKLLGTSEYRFIYKLHPSEYMNWSTLYQSLNNIEIEVIDNNDESIYYYFSQSDMQIGVYSTAIYEGLAFSLKTLLLRVGQYDVMKPLVDGGYAIYIDDEYQALNIIQNKKYKSINSDRFWKFNALNNIKAELDNELRLSSQFET